VSRGFVGLLKQSEGISDFLSLQISLIFGFNSTCIRLQRRLSLVKREREMDALRSNISSQKAVLYIKNEE